MLKLLWVEMMQNGYFALTCMYVTQNRYKAVPITTLVFKSSCVPFLVL